MVKETIGKIANYLKSEAGQVGSNLFLPLIYGKEMVDIVYPNKNPYVMAAEATIALAIGVTPILISAYPEKAKAALNSVKDTFTNGYNSLKSYANLNAKVASKES